MLSVSSISLTNKNQNPRIRIQKKELIKLHSQPQKDIVSFSGFGLHSRRIQNVVATTTIQERIKAFERLFEVPIECQEKSIFYEHGSHFQSKQKYSFVEIQQIYKKAHIRLKEEELKLKAYNSEDMLGEFANALYEYELKSQHSGRKRRGFKIEHPPENIINKKLNLNKKNNIKTHFTFHSLNPKHQELYKEGLVHKSFISKEMIEIIEQKSKIKSSEVTYNNQAYKLSQSGDSIQILKLS